MTDVTKRFTDRVTDYSRYRPGYPVEVINYLCEQALLSEDSAVADIGAGTGLFTQMLLAKAASVVAVEPNAAMRAESDARLSTHKHYSSLPGTAEKTGLSNGCVDLIASAQAFHWFETTQAKLEFARILKPTGRIVLIWNRRDSEASEFLQHYETLLQTQIPEYNKVSHSNATDDAIKTFLGPHLYKRTFENHQDFDLAGLRGRLLSSSYCPVKPAPAYAVLMQALEDLYQKYATKSGIRFDYSTQLYHN